MKIAAVILFVVLGCIAVVGYILNSRTPKAEGCANIDEVCESCSITSCLRNAVTVAAVAILAAQVWLLP